MNKIIAAIVVFFIPVAFWACGSSEPEGPTDAEIEAQELEAERVQCEDQFGNLIADLGKIDSALSIGLGYDQYTKLVINAKYEYDQFDVSDVDETCIREVGIYAETALRLYVKAQVLWEECPLCPDKYFQHLWSRATDSIEKATDGLENYGGTNVAIEGSSA